MLSVNENNLQFYQMHYHLNKTHFKMALLLFSVLVKVFMHLIFVYLFITLKVYYTCKHTKMFIC